MGVSYQDVATRLAQVEDKLEFVMKTFSITKEYRSAIMPDQVVREVRSLLDLYREVTAAGLQVMSREEAALNGINPDQTESV